MVAASPLTSVNVVCFSETYFCLNEFDVARQALVSHHHHRTAGDTFERRSIPFRYVWPSELDLMARLAGMTLRERWDGWTREPFTSDSTQHVSVWEKPARESPFSTWPGSG